MLVFARLIGRYPIAQNYGQKWRAKRHEQQKEAYVKAGGYGSCKEEGEFRQVPTAPEYDLSQQEADYQAQE